MIDQKKELKRVIFNLSQTQEYQIEYLNEIFKGLSFNLDELLLEFEDSRYLWEIYGEKIYNLLNHELCKIINEIDELELHKLDDLSHIKWNKARDISIRILHEIEIIENKNS